MYSPHLLLPFLLSHGETMRSIYIWNRNNNEDKVEKKDRGIEECIEEAKKKGEAGEN